MQDLSTLSQIVLFGLMALMGLFTLIVFGWQIMVLKGRSMENADGSADSWHEQKTHYGLAVADVFLACPMCLVGIVLVFIKPQWGFYLLGMVSFWFVWANTMTTATSLRFEKPKLTLNWWITFPTGIVIGLAFILWTVVHFDVIYF